MSSFERKVLRNKLKRNQGNNKIGQVFRYIQSIKNQKKYKAICKKLDKGM